MPLYLAGTTTTLSGTGFTWTWGMNLLCFSLRYGLENCVRLLINKNADIEFKDYYGNYLSYYIEYSSNKNISLVFESLVKERIDRFGIKVIKEEDKPQRNRIEENSRSNTEEFQVDKTKKEKEFQKKYPNKINQRLDKRGSLLVDLKYIKQ